MSMSSYCYHKVFSNHISQLNIGFHNVPYSCAALFCHKTMSLTKLLHLGLFCSL